jgi:hypothetical protein
MYLPITPARNDGSTIYKLTVRDIPVDGFWSLTVYNGEGYLQPNPTNAYAVNSITANRWHMEIPRGPACELSPRRRLPDQYQSNPPLVA